ncbi:hypothetical protein WJX84_011104 [Apatococcus fuscideae]|uniref:Rubisco LSMT substrate-binding domain-containing protein n=1 Tax=Apatococcus fuscideae TaxID=2026836 RepID=A0AAW1THV5_9CHLO
MTMQAPLVSQLRFRCWCGTSSGSLRPQKVTVRRKGSSPAAVQAALATQPSLQSQQLCSWAQSLSWSPQPSSPSPDDSSASPALWLQRDARRGEGLITVPCSLWITLGTVRRSQIGPHVDGLEPWLQLALFLLHERAMQEAGKAAGAPFTGYIMSLPQEPLLPLVWREEELGWLDGTQLLDTLAGYRQFFEGRHEELQESLFSQQPGLFPSEDACSFQSFLWAAAMVRSRVHAPLEQQRIALVPLADLVQHRRGEEQEWVVKGRGASESLEIRAGRPHTAGETVAMDFGIGKTDSQVALDYGCFDDTTRGPGFLLPLELPEEDRNFDDKADIVELSGLGVSQQFTLSSQEDPSTELLAFLRLMNLRGADSFLLEALFRNEAWGFMQMPVSEPNEKAVYDSMIEGCREAMAGRPALGQEYAALKRAEPGSRQELAYQVRVSELEALQHTLDFFQQRMAKLDKLEYYQERRLKGLGLLDDNGINTYDDFFKDSIA